MMIEMMIIVINVEDVGDGDGVEMMLIIKCWGSCRLCRYDNDFNLILFEYYDMMFMWW